MSRPAVARVDLSALRHNYRVARKLHGGRALAVVKANAYGHGALHCARALADEADGFAVACLEEALQLRAGGIHRPILVLEGIFAAGELVDVVREDLWIAVHQAEQIRMIESAAPKEARLHAWLKIDSGMHRAGFAPDEAASAYRRLLATGRVHKITLMSHFARADEPDSAATATQMARFEAAVAGLPGERSLANSAAVLGWPSSRRDWARPGIMLYGADPTPDPRHDLIPVMTLQSEVFAVKILRPGDELGYGARFTAARPTMVGLVAIGYADGYPRQAPDGTPVSVDGQHSRIIGRVSMDILTVDLTDVLGGGLGSRVELWGRDVSVNTVASAAGTIAYELLCNVKRVRMEYCNEDAPIAIANRTRQMPESQATV